MGQEDIFPIFGKKIVVTSTFFPPSPADQISGSENATLHTLSSEIFHVFSIKLMSYLGRHMILIL